MLTTDCPNWELQNAPTCRRLEHWPCENTLILLYNVIWFRELKSTFIAKRPFGIGKQEIRKLRCCEWQFNKQRVTRYFVPTRDAVERFKMNNVSCYCTNIPLEINHKTCFSAIVLFSKHFIHHFRSTWWVPYVFLCIAWRTIKFYVNCGQSASVFHFLNMLEYLAVGLAVFKYFVNISILPILYSTIFNKRHTPLGGLQENDILQKTKHSFGQKLSYKSKRRKFFYEIERTNIKKEKHTQNIGYYEN